MPKIVRAHIIIEATLETDDSAEAVRIIRADVDEMAAEFDLYSWEEREIEVEEL